MWTKEDLQQLVRREIGEYRLVVVSNRQPYVHKLVDGQVRHVVPAGGLINAIDPLMQACGGTWIAHGSGTGDRLVVEAGNRVMVPPDDPSYALRLIWLTEEEEQGYYYGFSNEGLWPLCHNAYTEPVFENRDWETYKSVNQLFAQHVLSEVGKGPAVVFIQDYHLALLPRMIHEVNPDIISGQFWHIPWPSPDIFRICPWQEEILEGLLGNNLLGFHIGEHSNNFVSSVARTLDARVDSEYGFINYQGNTTLVRPFPISVDFEEIEQEARSGDVSEEMERLVDELHLGDKLVGLGIDRIDYTKGIPHRFRAIGRFFEKHPECREKVVFIQAGVISRAGIDAYQRLGEQIEEILEDINGRFSRNGWQPIIYMPTDLPSTTLMALRRLARFCVVSSLHDGMNLVAKEYVASRFDEDGVLILSPFTGAAHELTQALIVNPYATDDFAEAIRTAIEMPPEKRRPRMRRLRNVVREQNIYAWGAAIVNELGKLGPRE
jgi:trehalose 6-phosphate synthase